MAFDLKNWSRQSVALNTGAVLVDGLPVGGPAIFSYRSGVDTVAQISAANYFASQAALFDLYVDDFIFVDGTDAAAVLQVATIDRTAGTITTVSTGLTGAVGTANLVNNAVTSAKIATNLVQYAAVPITAAEFNGMYAAPKLLVAAAGANTLIVLDKLELLMTYNSAAYAAGGPVAAQYDLTANGLGINASVTFAAASFQAVASTGFNLNAGIAPQTFTLCVNKGLYLSNTTAAFTSGNSALTAHIWYKVIPTV